MVAMQIALESLHATSIFKRKRIKLTSWQKLNKKSVVTRNIGLCVQICAQKKDACKGFIFHGETKECQMAVRAPKKPRRLMFWRGPRFGDFIIVHMPDSVWRRGEGKNILMLGHMINAGFWPTSDGMAFFRAWSNNHGVTWCLTTPPPFELSFAKKAKNFFTASFVLHC